VKENEAFNLSLLDNAPNPILVTGTDSSILYVKFSSGVLTGLWQLGTRGAKISLSLVAVEKSSKI